MRWKRLNQGKGFTLLEVLIATAILSMILIAVHSALQAGQTAWLIQEGQLNVQGQVRNALTMIKKDIQAAHYIDVDTSPGFSLKCQTTNNMEGPIYVMSSTGANANVLYRQDYSGGSMIENKVAARNISAIKATAAASGSRVEVDLTLQASFTAAFNKPQRLSVTQYFITRTGASIIE